MSALPPHLAALENSNATSARPEDRPASPDGDASGAGPALQTTSRTDVLQRLVHERAHRNPCVLCTVVDAAGSSPRKLGAKMLVFPDGNIVGTIGGGTIEFQIVQDALDVLQQGVARLADHHLTKDLGMCCGGRMRVFLEPQMYAPQLLLFGAGHVGQPLAAMASMAGFDVTVIDERPEQANPERYPDVHKLHVCPPADVLGKLSTDQDTYVVIVTHDHGLDQDILEHFLGLDLGYLGVIGSLRKREKFRQRLRAAGFEEEQVQSFRTPMGLDIGATTPEEIAVSVLAELIRVRRSDSEGPAPSMSSVKTGSARALTDSEDAPSTGRTQSDP